MQFTLKRAYLQFVFKMLAKKEYCINAWCKDSSASTEISHVSTHTHTQHYCVRIHVSQVLKPEAFWRRWCIFLFVVAVPAAVLLT